MSTPGEIFEGNAEFVPASIRILVGCVPCIQICADDFFAVKCHSNDAPIASDRHLIPLPSGFTRISGGSQGIVERTTVVAIGGFLVVCI